MTKNGALASRATAPENICLSVLLDTLLTPSHVMFSVFASSEVERGFESQSDQTRLYIQNRLCCFSAECAVARRNSKD